MADATPEGKQDGELTEGGDARASHIHGIRDATTSEALLARFLGLASAIGEHTVTITKAEILAVAKAKRASLGGGWTKETAKGFQAVLKAFGPGVDRVVARALIVVGSFMILFKNEPLPGVRKISRVVEGALVCI